MCCGAKSSKRVPVGNIDRPVFVWLYRLSPKVLDAPKIFQPETVIGWHRVGFPSVLALETTTARSARDRRGHSAAHSRDERRQPWPISSATKVNRRTSSTRASARRGP
jgi:hypothetical protein